MFSFSHNFSGANLTLIYTMLDELAKYYGERWMGFGHSLFLRSTENFWETHSQYRILRDEADKLNFKRQFKSVTFGFSRLEISILEVWTLQLLELLPKWLRAFIMQDIKSLLDDEDCDSPCIDQVDPETIWQDFKNKVSEEGTINLGELYDVR